MAISVSLQRADHASMPTTARYNIGAAFCFGTGDDYSAQFALSDATIAAGAHPENWRATRQGYFYLEAPGIEQERYPVPARGWYATDDDLATVVSAYTDVRATLDPASVTALGEAWQLCQPNNTTPTSTAGAAAGTQRPSPRPRTMENPMPYNESGNDAFTGADDDRSAVLAEEANADLEDLREQVAREIAEEFPHHGDPLIPDTSAGSAIPAYTGPDLAFADARPDAASQEQAEQAFDDVLRGLAGEGATTVTVADILARYPYRSRTWLSRRLSNVAEGAIVAPPGLGLERAERDGTYTIHHLTDAHA
jgi:hypothetical protein